MRDGGGNIDICRMRGQVMRTLLAAFPLTAALWLGLYHALPPVPDMAAPLDRLVFALKCCAVATLLCLLTGIQAVAHERLHTPAIDPLSGHETRRLRIDGRYLQNTLEQLMLFVPGLLVLAVYCADGAAMRAVAASTAVWILARFAFWIGYHIGPQYRAAGLVGMVQSALILLYVSARFGFEIGGWAGAAAPVVLFLCVEAVLLRQTVLRPRG